jgi:TolA-binding protein
MKKYLIILFIIVQSCAQVRSPYYEHISSETEEENDSIPVGYVEYEGQENDTIQNDENSNKSTTRYRVNSLRSDNYDDFGEYEEEQQGKIIKKIYSESREDTTTIYLNIHGIENNNSIVNIDDILLEAEDLFYDEDYKKANQKFVFINETVSSELPEKYISDYYLAENLITKNDFDDALIMLNKLYNSELTPSDIREKTTLRIGQIYCILGQNNKANEYFKIFRNKYSNSVYINLSDCNDG